MDPELNREPVELLADRGDVVDRGGLSPKRRVTVIQTGSNQRGRWAGEWTRV